MMKPGRVNHPARIALAVPYRAREALHARGWMVGPFRRAGSSTDEFDG